MMKLVAKTSLVHKTNITSYYRSSNLGSSKLLAAIESDGLKM